MDKRNIGMFLGYLFSFVFIAVIGMSFSAFVDKKQQVVVEAVFFVNAEGIVAQKNGETGGDSASKIKFKSSKIGVKPVSGELDTQTDIPYTVTSKIGSEGAFAKFQILSSKNWELVLQGSEGVSEKELENVMVSVEDTKVKAISLADIGGLLAKGEAKVRPQKFVIMVWLDQHVGKDIIASKINIHVALREA